MSDQTPDLSTYLGQLEAQRATLSIQIAGVRAALGLQAEDGQPAVPVSGGIAPTGAVAVRVIQGKIRVDEFFRLSTPQAVKKYLAIMKQPQGPKAIAEGLKAGGLITNAKNLYANVFTALKRLRIAGEVALTPNGWGLSEWYPNQPKGGPDKKKGRRRGTKKKAVNTKPAAKKASGYRAFIAEQMRGGKSMAEAAETWRKQKGSES